MFTENSIELLTNRIKWRKPLGGKYATILISEITARDIDKAFQDVHKLVTIENIHDTQENVNITNEQFNELLKRMQRIAINRVLEDVFTNNERADFKKIYDVVITERASVFDKSIKLALGVQVLEQLITTTRLNINERLKKQSYSKLKVELEGAKNESGRTVSVGLNYRYQKSIQDVIDILFPKDKNVYVDFSNDW